MDGMLKMCGVDWCRCFHFCFNSCFLLFIDLEKESTSKKHHFEQLKWMYVLISSFLFWRLLLSLDWYFLRHFFLENTFYSLRNKFTLKVWNNESSTRSFTYVLHWTRVFICVPFSLKLILEIDISLCSSVENSMKISK